MDLYGEGVASEGPDREVPVEHLDYSYVDKCNDWKELRAILEVLKSGKEGKYPHLEQHVEKRMLSNMPDGERSKWIALNKTPGWEEQRAAADELAAFLRSMAPAPVPGAAAAAASPATAAAAQAASAASAPRAAAPAAGGAGGSSSKSVHTVPPVRGSGKPTAVPVTAASSSSASAVAAIESDGTGASAGAGSEAAAEAARKRDSKAEPFKDYYSRWEKYDVDAALSAAEQEEARGRAERAAAAEKEAAAARERRRGELSKLKLTQDPALLSATERDFAARREKEKGNESFKAGDMEEAILYYSRSLAYDCTSGLAAAVYANRAQARLRDKAWASAEDDCTACLALEPSNLKAWYRRATARMKRGKYTEALADCEQAGRIDGAADGKMAGEIRKLAEEIKEKARSAAPPEAPAPAPAPVAKSKPAALPAPVPAPAPAAAPAKPLISEVPAPAPAAAAPASSGKARRMVIEEDSDEEEEEEEEQATVAPVHKPAPAPAPVPAPAPAATSSGARRVVIEEDSDDEDEDEEEEAAPAAAVKGRPAASGSAAAASGDEAEQEKDRGNKLFQAGQYADAVAAYSRSLLLRAGTPSPAVLSNRAAARLKLGQWASAAVDCTSALRAAGLSEEAVQQLAAAGDAGEPAPDAAAARLAPEMVSVCVKALYRRFQAQREAKKSAEARADLAAACALEPHNTKLREELREVKALAAAEKQATRAASAGSASAAVKPPPVPHASPAPAPATPAKPLVQEAPSTGAAAAAAAAADTAATRSPAPAPAPTAPAASPTSATKPAASSAGSPAPVTAAALTAAAAAAVAAAQSMSPSSAAAIPAPPRTALDVEKAVSALKRNPAGLAAYLQQIDGVSLPALFKRPVEPDTVSLILKGLTQHWAGGSVPDAAQATWLQKFMEGLRQTNGWDTTAMMFEDAEVDCARQLLEYLPPAAKVSSALRAAFRVDES